MTKVALISGASRGLGRALALELSKTHHIVAVAKTTGALEELDDEIKAQGGSATLAPMDINVEAAMATLCRGIYDRWGALNVWAHTAIHAAPLTPASNVDAKDMAKSIETNVTATARLIPFVAPLLKEAGTALFFDDPRSGEPFFASYGSTKSAQIALARSWATETQKSGPRVVIATPAPMPTATRARFFPGEDKTALAAPHQEAVRILADAGLT